MENNFQASLDFVLDQEKGFVDNPKDPGGATNLGCTKKTWEDWVGHPVTVDDIKNLTPEDVAPLYKKRYWDACHCSELPNGVDLCVFDMAINSGPVRAIKTLQSCLGVTTDGIIGPGTINAANSIPTAQLIDEYTTSRGTFLMGLPTYIDYGRGWMARVNRCDEKAMSML